MKTALHLGMVRRHLKEQGIAQTLLYVKQSGIRQVLLPVCPAGEEELRAARAASEQTGVSILGIEAVYGSAKRFPGDLDLASEAEQAVAAVKEVGGSYLCIAEMPDAFLAGETEIRRVCGEWNTLGKRLSEAGIQLVYQVHNEEFEKVGDRYILDVVLEAADLVKLGLDTFWVHMGGQFTDQWLAKTAGRCEFLNVQDILVQTPKGSHLVRSLLLDDSVKTAEVTTGNLNFPRILQAAEDAGVPYLCINQEQTYAHTPFESVGNNVKYLKTLQVFEGNKS